MVSDSLAHVRDELWISNNNVWASGDDCFHHLQVVLQSVSEKQQTITSENQRMFGVSPENEFYVNPERPACVLPLSSPFYLNELPADVQWSLSLLLCFWSVLRKRSSQRHNDTDFISQPRGCRAFSRLQLVWSGTLSCWFSRETSLNSPGLVASSWGETQTGGPPSDLQALKSTSSDAFTCYWTADSDDLFLLLDIPLIINPSHENSL